MHTYRDDNGTVDLTTEYAPSIEGKGGTGSLCALRSLFCSIGFECL